MEAVVITTYGTSSEDFGLWGNLIPDKIAPIQFVICPPILS